MFTEYKMQCFLSQLQDGEEYVIPKDSSNYAITKFGRVYSTTRKAGKTGGFLPGSIQNREGHLPYIRYGIYDNNGKCKDWFAQRLIYYYFGKKPLQKGNVIHHIDFDPHNNNIDNLMWFENQSEHKAYHEAIGHPIGGRPRKNRGGESAE